MKKKKTLTGPSGRGEVPENLCEKTALITYKACYKLSVLFSVHFGNRLAFIETTGLQFLNVMATHSYQMK